MGIKNGEKMIKDLRDATRQLRNAENNLKIKRANPHIQTGCAGFSYFKYEMWFYDFRHEVSKKFSVESLNEEVQTLLNTAQHLENVCDRLQKGRYPDPKIIYKIGELDEE